MRNLYTLILCFFSLFCFSQKDESLNDLLEKLNSKKNIHFSIGKSKQNQKFCLLSIMETTQYKIYFPFSYKDLKLKPLIAKSSGGNILIFSKKEKQYLVINYFTGETVGRTNKKKMFLKFSFQGWDLVNGQSILLDNSLKPVKHILFPSELHNITSEKKDNTMIVQNTDDNKSYDVNLATSFYNIPLNELFSSFYLKNEEEYENEPVEDNDFFIFLKDKNICFCK